MYNIYKFKMKNLRILSSALILLQIVQIRCEESYENNNVRSWVWMFQKLVSMLLHCVVANGNCTNLLMAMFFFLNLVTKINYIKNFRTLK